MLSALAVADATSCRYLRVESVILPRMECSEIEVFSGGKNVLLNRPDKLIGGMFGYNAYKRSDNPQQAIDLTDGDTKKDCPVCDPYKREYSPFFEIDLGVMMPVDRLVLHCARYAMWQKMAGKQGYSGAVDNGWRLVTTMDENRKVLTCQFVDIYSKDYADKSGVIEIIPAAQFAEMQGRVIPVGARVWISTADALLMSGEVEVQEPKTDRALLAEFEHRNDPENIVKLAKDFIKLLNLENPQLASIKQLAEDGKWVEALEAYKVRFVTVMVNRTGLGNETNKIAAWSLGYLYTWEPVNLLNADDLLEGKRIISDPTGKGLVVQEIGENGMIPPYGFFGGSSYETNLGKNENILLRAYAQTGEKKYLDRWARFYDDCMMRLRQQEKDAKGNLELEKKFMAERFVLQAGEKYIAIMCKDFINTLNLQPQFAQELPAPTLARIITYWLEIYGPTYWRVARKCSFNHLFNSVAGSYISARILEDFRAGEYWMNEVKRDFDRLYTLSTTRDGSMIEVGDEGHLGGVLGSPANLYFQMKADNEDWFDKGTETKFLSDFHTQVRYLLAHMAPGGYGHRTENNDYSELLRLRMQLSSNDRWERRDGFNFFNFCVKTLANGVFHEPEPRAILDYVFGHRADERTLSRHRQNFQTEMINYLGDVVAPRPTFRSDFMPYAGLHYLRGGWRYDDPFLHMLCQPEGGGANVAGIDRWGYPGTQFYDTEFTYWDYGVRLLVSLPVLVDGRSQYRQYGRQGLCPGSKTARLTEAPEKPMPNRWLAGKNFDFTECFVDGAYQNIEFECDEIKNGVSSVRKIGAYGPPPAQEARMTAQDTPVFMHTQRQVIFLRNQRMFITTDRLQPKEADSTHDYMMDCILPLNAKEGGAPFSEEQLHVDGKTPQIKTLNPDTASVSAGYFCSSDLSVVSQDSEQFIGNRNSRPAPSQERFGGTLTDRAASGEKRIDFAERRAQLAWTAKGDSAVVGVMASRATQDAVVFTDLINCSTEAAPAFSAKMKSGEVIEYTAANSGQKPLSSFGIDATSEALLVVKGKDGYSGVVLNASAFIVGGKSVQIQTPDFAFAVTAKGELAMEAIRRPIDPPSMQPNTTCFTGTMMMTLESKTSDIEIRYTINGLEPTMESPLYTGPVKLTDTTFVQARAFRKGVKEIPFGFNGTDVSAVSYATFTRRGYTRRPEVDKKNLEVGLDYEYLEAGSWFQLYSFADTLDAKSSGKTNQLMDISMRQTDDPFGVRYLGYLDVPESSVYTFHAPKEFVRNICEPGYDLRVWIDGEEWDLSTTWHGLGTWSVPLEKGLHTLKVIFADAREKDIDHQHSQLSMFYPTPWSVWRGTAPGLEISSDKIERQPIPASWLLRKKIR